MDIVLVLVSLLVLGFSKGRNQLKLKGFFPNRMQEKIENYKNIIFKM